MRRLDMNDKSKMKGILKKVLWIVLTFVFLEALLIAALEVIYTLSEYKLAINTEIIGTHLKETFTHLRNYIQINWAQKNPFFILGTGVVFIYSVFTHMGKIKKEGWDTEESNAYHGSARWGRPQEVVDNKNFTKKSKKQVQTEFQKSLER